MLPPGFWLCSAFFSLYIIMRSPHHRCERQWGQVDQEAQKAERRLSHRPNIWPSGALDWAVSIWVSFYLYYIWANSRSYEMRCLVWGNMEWEEKASSCLPVSREKGIRSPWTSNRKNPENQTDELISLETKNTEKGCILTWVDRRYRLKLQKDVNFQHKQVEENLGWK